VARWFWLGATFSAVCSANRSARIAEQALQEQRRPLLVNARLDDPLQKVMFANVHWFRAEGSEAVIEEEDGTLYLTLALRNVGSGIAVLEGWHSWPELVASHVGHPPPEHFRRQVRDIYIAAGDVGMWQGVLRDDATTLSPGSQPLTPSGARSASTCSTATRSEGTTISRFVATPAGDDQWLGYVEAALEPRSRRPRQLGPP